MAGKYLGGKKRATTNHFNVATPSVLVLLLLVFFSVLVFVYMAGQLHFFQTILRVHQVNDVLVNNNGDFSINFQQVRNYTPPTTNDEPSPPMEELWLTTPSDDGRVGRIPHLINKIFLSKDGQFTEMSDGYKRAHQSWLDMNPGYNLRYFNLITARKYLRTHFHPIFVRTFDCIEAFAGKSDFFRMALLYRDGE